MKHLIQNIWGKYVKKAMNESYKISDKTQIAIH